MAARITIRLTTITDHPPVDEFLNALHNAYDILREVDAAISGRPQGTLRWRIADLRLGSATATLDAESVAEDIDVGPEVVRAVAKGLEQIEATAERTPSYFTEDALEKAKRLVGVLNDEVTKISVTAAGIAPVVLTQRVAANVDALIGAQYEATGSIEGILETLSVHGRLRFTIYELLSGRGIPCYFREDRIDDAHGAFRKRVSVYGNIKYDRSGRPLSISVESLTPLRDRRDLPQASDLEGIDVTQGMDATQYIRKLRDG